jgi:hypothetical protein
MGVDSMKTPEDEAFDDLAQRQGDWGGGYQAKREAALDKLVQEQERLGLYDLAPQRPWVGLTDEEIDKTYWAMPRINKPQPTQFEFARAVEQLLKEKNT